MDYGAQNERRMEMNMKKINYIFIAIVMFVLTGTGIQIIFSKDVLFSVNENRYLAKKPDISFDCILSKKIKMIWKNLRFVSAFIKSCENIEFKAMLVPGSGNILT